MKPSERIQEIRKQLLKDKGVKDEGVGHGLIDALLKYLDELYENDKSPDQIYQFIKN